MQPVFAVMLMVFATASADTPCTPADVASTFTPCDQFGQRQAIQYWARECSTGAGTPTLLAPRSTPCVVECASGTFYSPKTLGCDQCPAGTYSFATGDIYVRFPSLPDKFATYCKPEPCQAWQSGPSGTYLFSGNQTTDKADQSVVVSLLLAVTVVASGGGSVAFSYRVESEEMFDGLGLSLNGTRYQTTPLAYYISSGVHSQWRSLTVPLPLGTTEVLWTYEKDADDSSPRGRLGVGTDRAYLRHIQVDGTRLTADECQLCPRGHYSQGGATKCAMCPANTTAVGGASVCTPCGAGFWAPTGSDQCMRIKPCDLQLDFVPQYSTCVGGLHGTRSKSWLQSNQFCDGTVTPPVESNVPCAACMPGKQEGEAGTCQPCATGSALIDGSCSACPAGTSAIKSVLYNDFDLLNNDLSSGGFTTVCKGLCRGCNKSCASGNGWEIVTIMDPTHQLELAALHSGFSHGYFVETSLFKTITLYTRGRIVFGYFFTRRYNGDMASIEDVEGEFFMDLVQIPLDTNYDSMGRPGIVTSDPLDAGTYTLKWSFRKNWVHDEDNPIALVVARLSIEGEASGAASSCTTCAPGYYCPVGLDGMSPCPSGFYSSKGGSAVCDRCTGSEVSTEYAQEMCVACPSGTLPSGNNDRCDNQCRYKEDDYEYDLTALRGRRFGPILSNNAFEDNRNANDAINMHRFYFELCSPVNGDDSDDTCKLRFGQRVELAYVCQRLNANRSYSLGDWVSYRSLGNTGVEMKFTSGDMCSNGQARSTNITLLCVDPKSTTRKVEFMGEGPQCHYSFTVYTPHACPVCTETSFNKTESDCDVSGMQIETWFVRPEAEGCYGGMELPPPKSVHCNRCLPPYYAFTWSTCDGGSQHTMYFVKTEHVGCVDDGSNTPHVMSRSCLTVDAKPGANTFTIVVLVVVSVTVIMALCLWRVAKERNKLRVQYSLLSREAAQSGEMVDVPNSAVEDGGDDDDEFNEPHARSTS